MKLFPNKEKSRLNFLEEEYPKTIGEVKFLRKRVHKLEELNTHLLTFAPGNSKPLINQVLGVTNPIIIQNRASIGFDTVEKVVNHVLNMDLSGKTKGCGCICCEQRHIEYKKNKEIEQLHSLINKLTVANRIREELKVDPLSLFPIIKVDKDHIREAKGKGIKVIPYHYYNSKTLKKDTESKKESISLDIFDTNNHVVGVDIFGSPFTQEYGYILFNNPDLMLKQLDAYKKRLNKATKDYETAKNRRIKLNKAFYIP